MKIDINTGATWLRYLMVLVMVCIASESAASSFFYNGFVTGGSGAGPVLTPPGDLVYLSFDIDGLQPGDSVNGSDIASLEFYVGGFCFSAITDASGCLSGGVLVPIINVETEMMVYTPFANDPFDGELNFLGFSPTFQVMPEINIDFDTLLFTIDLNQLGSISGCLNKATLESAPCYTPVPLPGAVLLLGSALLMLRPKGSRVPKSGAGGNVITCLEVGCRW